MTTSQRIDPTDSELDELYDLWNLRGVSKTEIERTYLNAPNSHGKYITHLWWTRLGLNTTRR